MQVHNAPYPSENLKYASNTSELVEHYVPANEVY